MEQGSMEQGSMERSDGMRVRRRRPSRFSSAFDVESFPIGEVRQYVPGEQSAALAELPFYDLVPKDLVGQIKWRLYVRERCLVDEEFRRAIDTACEADVLFFANTLCYVHEPRPIPRDLPLNSWPDQDEALAAMDECFGVREFGAEKSRGVGFSYSLIVLFLQKWLFMRGVKLGLVSRDEATVDTKGDPDSLMAKLDFEYEWLPQHLRLCNDGRGRKKLDRTYSKHRFLNVEMAASINGYSATGDVMSGGRKTAIGLDEFGKFKVPEDKAALASTQHVTGCRYFISTYKGNTNEFYRLMKIVSTMLKFIADWKHNPERSRGLYTSKDGELIVIDTTYSWPPGYNFILDGRYRSAWYDAEWRRPGATPQAIAEELDRNPRGSVAKVFCDEAFAAQAEFICSPMVSGSLLYDEETATPDKFLPKSNGRLQLWMPVTDGQPGFTGPFILSCDISAGTGSSSASNSSIVVIDSRRREQVAEYINNAIRPWAFARLAVALARWLNAGRRDSNTLIIFENNGPTGSDFSRALKGLGYYSIYRPKSKSSKARVVEFGYRKTGDGAELFQMLEGYMIQKLIRIHSQAVLDECDQYEWRAGQVKHIGAAEGEDESAVGRPHGDVAIAISMACMLLSTGIVKPREPEPDDPPPGSVGAMYLAAQESIALNKSGPWWGTIPVNPYEWN